MSCTSNGTHSQTVVQLTLCLLYTSVPSTTIFARMALVPWNVITLISMWRLIQSKILVGSMYWVYSHLQTVAGYHEDSLVISKQNRVSRRVIKCSESFIKMLSQHILPAIQNFYVEKILTEPGRPSTTSVALINCGVRQGYPVSYTHL